MKRIMLVRTRERIEDSLYLHIVAPPLGLLYLASQIRKKFPYEYDIKIIDMRLSRLSVRKMEAEIKNFGPDIVGCSVCSCEHECMNEIADLSKKINGNIKFIVGGPHPTMYYEDVIKNNNIDVAVIGEGEETICELLDSFENNERIDKIPGIAFKKENQIVKTDSRIPIYDLDSIPFPAWDLIALARYSEIDKESMNSMLSGSRYMVIFTSRGCPFQCTYCHNIFGKIYRKRSPENVFKEILELYNKYGVDEFQVLDDVFNFDKKRAKDICDLIISSGIKIWISFPNGLRGDILDEELLERLKLAGTYSITFALETASPRMQTIIKKDVNIKKLDAMIKSADDKKIHTRSFFMLGFPGETIEEAKKTIDFACKSKLCRANFFIVKPQRSTQLFEMVKKAYPDFQLDFNKYFYEAVDRNYEEKVVKFPVDRLIQYAYIKFYLNPQRLIKIWCRTRRKVFLFMKLSHLSSMLRIM